MQHLPYLPSRRFSWLNLLIIAAVLLIALVGCSSEPEDSVFVEVQPRVLNPGDQIPAAQGETILEVSGGTVGETTISIDTESLESLGTIKYTINDPYEEEVVEYEGVLLETLFDQFGDENSTEVHIVAINDYAETIPRTHVEKWPVMVALKANGIYASSDHRGPSMIIYPYDQFPEINPTTHDRFWVWQIKSMSFN